MTWRAWWPPARGRSELRDDPTAPLLQGEAAAVDVDRGDTPAGGEQVGGAPPPIAGPQAAAPGSVLHHGLAAATAADHTREPEAFRHAGGNGAHRGNGAGGPWPVSWRAGSPGGGRQRPARHHVAEGITPANGYGGDHFLARGQRHQAGAGSSRRGYGRGGRLLAWDGRRWGGQVGGLLRSATASQQGGEQQAHGRNHRPGPAKGVSPSPQGRESGQGSPAAPWSRCPPSWLAPSGEQAWGAGRSSP